MTSLALSFNDVNFTPVQHEQQIWLTASELAKALGYSKSNAVTQVYERNKDEFNTSMTTTLNLSVNDSIENLNLRLSKKEQNLVKTVRIFSLRGCHLIAMFSKTAVAKQFRKWVLDILDREVLTQQVNLRQAISPEQQASLQEIVARRAEGCGKARMEMWSRHNNHFKISKYSQLLAIHFDDAKYYLETMEIKAKTTTHTKVDSSYIHNAEGLAIHMVWVYKWWKEFGGAIRIISPKMAGAINDHFIDGMCFASHFIEKETRQRIDEKAQYHQWHLSHAEKMALDYRTK